jgi:hypothetical protein
MEIPFTAIADSFLSRFTAGSRIPDQEKEAGCPAQERRSNASPGKCAS